MESCRKEDFSETSAVHEGEFRNFLNIGVAKVYTLKQSATVACMRSDSHKMLCESKCGDSRVECFWQRLLRVKVEQVQFTAKTSKSETVSKQRTSSSSSVSSSCWLLVGSVCSPHVLIIKGTVPCDNLAKLPTAPHRQTAGHSCRHFR